MNASCKTTIAMATAFPMNVRAIAMMTARPMLVKPIATTTVSPMIAILPKAPAKTAMAMASQMSANPRDPAVLVNHAWSPSRLVV